MKLWACRVRWYWPGRQDPGYRRDYFLAGRLCFPDYPRSPIGVALFATRREARRAIASRENMIGSPVRVEVLIKQEWWNNERMGERKLSEVRRAVRLSNG